MIIGLLVVLGLGIVSIPMMMDSEPAPSASQNANKPTVNLAPAPVVPVIKNKFLADVERLGLTEYFNSITEKFECIAKENGINNIFVKYDENENNKKIEKDIREYITSGAIAEEEKWVTQLSQFTQFSVNGVYGVAEFESDSYKFLTAKNFYDIFQNFQAKMSDGTSLISNMQNLNVRLKDPEYIKKNSSFFTHVLWHNFLLANNKTLESNLFRILVLILKKVLGKIIAPIDLYMNYKQAYINLLGASELNEMPWELDRIFLISPTLQHKIIELATISECKFPARMYCVMLIESLEEFRKVRREYVENRNNFYKEILNNF